MTPLLALLLAAAPPAPDGRWVPFDVPEQSGSAFYDDGSVERTGDTLRVWVRWNPEDEAAPFHEARALTEIDCRTRTGRLVRMAVYDSDGALIGTEDGDESAQPIRTGYAANGIERALCPGTR